MGEKIVRVRKWIVIDALVLLALSAYEFISRVDAMWGPLKMFVSMAAGEGISLQRAAKYVDISIFETPCFMLLCMLLSLFAMLCIRKRSAGYVLLPFSLALTVWGIFVQMSLLGELIRFVKVLPLLMMSVLFAAGIYLQRKQLRALRARAQRIGHYAGYSPVPPQRMEGRRFQQGFTDHPSRLPRRKRAS